MRCSEWLTPEELQELSTAPTAGWHSLDDGASIGVRRALVEAAVRLRCRPEVRPRVCVDSDTMDTLERTFCGRVNGHHMAYTANSDCRWVLHTYDFTRNSTD